MNNREKLLRLSMQPDTLGSMIAILAMPIGKAGTTHEFEPESGWRVTDTSPSAIAHFRTLPMRRYTDPAGVIILTAVKGDTIHFLAEGDGWAIECEDINGGWEAKGFFFRGGAAGAGSVTGSGLTVPNKTPTVSTSYPPYKEDEILRGRVTDFDWLNEIATGEFRVLTLLHMEVRNRELDWASVADSERPVSDMMALIEEDEYSNRLPDQHMLSSYDQNRKREYHAAGRFSRLLIDRLDTVGAISHWNDDALTPQVKFLLQETGFTLMPSDDHDYWAILDVLEENILAGVARTKTRWTVERAPRDGEPSGRLVSHARLPLNDPAVLSAIKEIADTVGSEARSRHR
jgi:hypothetical protein